MSNPLGEMQKADRGQIVPTLPAACGSNTFTIGPTLNDRVEALINLHIHISEFNRIVKFCNGNRHRRDHNTRIVFHPGYGFPAEVRWSVERQCWYDASEKVSGDVAETADAQARSDHSQCTTDRCEGSNPSVTQNSDWRKNPACPPGHRLLTEGDIQTGDQCWYLGRWNQAVLLVGKPVQMLLDRNQKVARPITAPAIPPGLPEIPEGWEYYEGTINPGERFMHCSPSLANEKNEYIRSWSTWFYEPLADPCKYPEPAKDGNMWYAIRPKQSSGAGDGSVPSGAPRRADVSPAPDPIQASDEDPVAVAREVSERIVRRMLADRAKRVICDAVEELGYRGAHFNRGCFRAELQHGKCSYTLSTCQMLIETSGDAQFETDRLLTLARKFKQAVEAMK